MQMSVCDALASVFNLLATTASMLCLLPCCHALLLRAELIDTQVTL